MRYCSICNSKNNINYTNINLNFPDDINLSKTLSIYYCYLCYFYYNDNNLNQEDYNSYYIKFNNYKDTIISLDKDEKCYNFLKNNIDIGKTIIDFGCGNFELANMLKDNYIIHTYDIGMEFPNKKYNCIILSHVLEHIFDINNFIENLEKILEKEGMIYIEVPNAEYYHLLNDICPLQEINLEHINFFSKFALNKLMIKHNYYSKILIDDFFTICNQKYYVIRGLFEKKNNNLSFENYIINGLESINKFDYIKINTYKNIYIYGCGQLLFKILDYIKTNIINIIDDNKCYLAKKINGIEIINFDIFKNKVNEYDTIVISSLISFNKIKEKLELINKKLNIISLN